MFIRGLLRLLYFAALVYLAYAVYRLLFGSARRKVAAAGRKKLSGVMVKDETCQTYLPREDAIRETFEGREYFFCSKTCRQKFLDAKKKTP